MKGLTEPNVAVTVYWIRWTWFDKNQSFPQDFLFFVKDKDAFEICCKTKMQIILKSIILLKSNQKTYKGKVKDKEIR